MPACDGLREGLEAGTRAEGSDKRFLSLSGGSRHCDNTKKINQNTTEPHSRPSVRGAGYYVGCMLKIGGTDHCSSPRRYVV